MSLDLHDHGSTPDHGPVEALREHWKATLEEAHALRDLLCAKVAARGQNKYEICELLHQARERKVHEPLGFRSFGAFAVKFGAATSESNARQLANLFEQLKPLPGITRVFRTGQAHWTKVREVAPVATPEDEDDWVDWLLEESYDQLKARAQRKRGEEPTVRLSVDVTLPVHARFRARVQALSEKLGRRVSDGEGIDHLLTAAERGGGGEPLPSARIHVFRTDRAGTTAEIEGPGGPIPLTREELEELECDAEHQDLLGNVKRWIPVKTRRVVYARDRGRCSVRGCGALGYIHQHHVGEGGWRETGHDAEGLLLLCAGHHRLVHRGWLRIEGTYTTGFRFFDVRGVELTDASPPSLPRRCA